MRATPKAASTIAFPHPLQPSRRGFFMGRNGTMCTVRGALQPTPSARLEPSETALVDPRLARGRRAQPAPPLQAAFDDRGPRMNARIKPADFTDYKVADLNLAA